MLVQVQSPASFLQSFDAFFFDFDGILVDTEPFHFRAYTEMLSELGCILEWNFSLYCQWAHDSDPLCLCNKLASLYPTLIDPAKWMDHRKRKEAIYRQIILQEAMPLMDGVEDLLRFLFTLNHPITVVTNSKRDHVEIIVEHLPLLQQIPHWVYREDSPEPKPSPMPYLIGIERFGKGCQRPLGFEDSLKGICALLKAHITPILIAPHLTPPMKLYHFSSFREMLTTV